VNLGHGTTKQRHNQDRRGISHRRFDALPATIVVHIEFPRDALQQKACVRRDNANVQVCQSKTEFGGSVPKGQRDPKECPSTDKFPTAGQA
jgi:hypothetical protein